MQATTRTDIDTVGKSQFLPVSASVAVLGCIGRVNFHQIPTGAFSLVGEHGEEPGPGRVRNAFGQTMIMDHTVDVQIFNADGPVFIDDLTRFLMNEVIPPKTDAFMCPANDLTPFSSLGGSLSGLAQFSLSLGQGLFLFPEEAGVFNRRGLIGKGSKGMQAHVDAHSLIAGRKMQSFNFATEGYVPFAGGRAADGGRLGFTAHLPVHDNLDMANLGDRQPTIFDAAPGRDLGEGDGIVPALTLKPRKARLLTGLATAEERFEGQVYSDCYILQNLGMGQVDIAGRLDAGKHSGLLVIAQRGLLNLPGIFTLLQQAVVEIPALFQDSLKRRSLLFGRENPVFESLKHLSQYNLIYRRSQGKTA